MTNTELVELLREARNSVALEVAAYTAFRVSDADKRVLDLLKRIDAALAEHDVVPPSDVKMEWEETNGPTELRARLVGAKMEVYQTFMREWYWRTVLFNDKPVRTLDEAQRAALAAARGMR